MGGLQRFENRLEQAISGVFARAFRSAVQPVEIAAALQREVRQQRPDPQPRPPAGAQRLPRRAQPGRPRAARAVRLRAGRRARRAARGARRRAVLRLPGPGHHHLRDRRRPVDRPVPGAQRGAGQGAGQRPRAPGYAGRGRSSRSTAPATRSHPPGLVVGRGTEADLRINDPGVSRRHVEFSVSIGTVEDGSPLASRVRDLGSTNGMLVDGHQVTKAALRDGVARSRSATPTMTVRVVEDADRGGASMSELTLFLIRLAYLAILWIFVLSAISVIRSDMFGARVPESARGGRRRRRSAGASRPDPSRRRGAPTHVAGRRGRQRRASAPSSTRRRS